MSPLFSMVVPARITSGTYMLTDAHNKPCFDTFYHRQTHCVMHVFKKFVPKLNPSYLNNEMYI